MMQEFGRAWVVSGVPVWYKVVQARPSPQSGVCSKLIRDADREGTRVEIRRAPAWSHLWSARQMIVDWNSVKQLAAIVGLYAATFFLLDATASPACLIAATALWWRGP